MPKESKRHSLSSNSTRSSPYPSRSNQATRAISKKDLEAEKDRKEWEEVRCPVCMEHPHNAVLLKCSSYDKGCRPYMCNTSCRHSNCLDQFCKAFANTKTDSIEGASSSNHRNTGDYGSSQKHVKFICPLCRGDASDWIVVEAARNFMNSKTRSCACETCDYSGTYADLRRHARLEHPLVRPSETDPEREHRWTRMEQERDFGDLLSTIQSTTFGDENIDEDNFMVGPTILNVIILLSYPGVPPLPIRASASRSIGQFRSSRNPNTTSMTRLWGENVDVEANSFGRENDTGSSEIFLNRRTRSRRSRRQFRNRSIMPATQLWGENIGNESGSNSVEDGSGSSESSSGGFWHNQRQRR